MQLGETKRGVSGSRGRGVAVLSELSGNIPLTLAPALTLKGFLVRFFWFCWPVRGKAAVEEGEELGVAGLEGRERLCSAQGLLLGAEIPQTCLGSRRLPRQCFRTIFLEAAFLSKVPRANSD